MNPSPAEPSPSRRSLPGLLALGLVGAFHPARAEVTLAALFRDHAVLQCDKPLPIWGQAAAGEQVIVSFKQQRATATAGADGRWLVRLKAEPPSAVPAELIATGRNKVTVRDVLVGEVWLASGQSNIARPLSGTLDAPKEIAAADYPLIRHFAVRRTVEEKPVSGMEGEWQMCTPAVAGGFSGVGYFFTRDLHRRLGVPVGLINNSWGGTPIESWISDEALRATSVYPAIAARFEKDTADFSERQRLHPVESAGWMKAEEHAHATQTPNPVSWPKVPIGPRTAYAPSRLYNGMIAPLLPVALRGVVWWQGEANVVRAGEYAELFQTLIRSWRGAWGRGDFPFYFVQLTNYEVGWDSSRLVWAQLRAAQARALELPNTGMVVTMDIGDPFEMHLLNKQEAGRRLALLAASRTYGLDGPWTGPVFASAEREGGTMRVRFADTGSAPVIRGPRISALELAGADRVFHRGEARIEGNSLVVSSPEVKEPVAVRYAWTNAPDGNLFNEGGLPAPSFRSDDW